MIIVLLTWLSIFFIFISFGDFLVFSYNKITKQNEKYGVTNTFILGMCFTLIPLSITSIWLPSNHYMMFAYIILGVVYWMYRRQHLQKLLCNFKRAWSSYSNFQRIIFAIAFFCFLILVLWQKSVGDAYSYHYQLTNWNESYRAVVGIANVETRMGFNSNYSLISAIFTFRFLADGQNFLLQSLLALLICFSIIRQIIKSNYDIYRVIILFLFVIISFYELGYLTNSSTDIIPILCVFFISTNVILRPYLLKEHFLLLLFVPVCLVTFKISTVAFCILSIYPLFYLCQKKHFRSLSICAGLGVIAILFWCIRNVIISGYLVYPIYEIDLFSFDWKVSEYVTLKEQWFIREYPKLAFNADCFFMKYFITHGGVDHLQYRFFVTFSAYFLIILSFLSPIFVGLGYLKKIRINNALYFVFGVLAVYIIFGCLTAFDFRFFAGPIAGMILLEVIFIFNILKLKRNRVNKICKYVWFLPILLIFAISVKSIYNGWIDWQNKGFGKKEYFSLILFKPYTTAAWTKNLELKIYKMNDSIDIYISDKNPFVTYDKLPSTSIVVGERKWQSIETIEPRGDKLEDGFRPKPVIDIK